MKKAEVQKQIELYFGADAKSSKRTGIFETISTLKAKAVQQYQLALKAKSFDLLEWARDYFFKQEFLAKNFYTLTFVFLVVRCLLFPMQLPHHEIFAIHPSYSAG